MKDIDRNINSQLYNKEPVQKELTVKQIARQVFTMKANSNNTSGTLTNVKLKNKIYYLKVVCTGELSELTKIMLRYNSNVICCAFFPPQEEMSLGATTGVIICDSPFSNIQVSIEKGTNVTKNTIFSVEIYEEL